MEQLKLDSDGKSVSAWEVVFEHDGRQEVLVVYCLNVLDGKVHDCRHDCSTDVVKRVEFLDQVE